MVPGTRDVSRRFLPTDGPPYESRVRDFRAEASRPSPISGLLSWDRLPTASPVPGSSPGVLFMAAHSVQASGDGCSSTTLLLAQPPPCQLSSSTPDGTPGWLLSLHLGLLSAVPRRAASPLLLMGEPSWGPGSHHLATPLLSLGLLTGGSSYGPAPAVFGMTPLGLHEPQRPDRLSPSLTVMRIP